MSDIRTHLVEAHAWTDFDFSLFGDTEREQGVYLSGAHGQEHENQPLLSHSHAESVCDWFALCNDEAVGTADHPAIGPVAICQRCSDKLGIPLI